ncbi:uncharacterized protein LOC115880805 isoform X1 [Sitophilus oryzae]|uniref:Uncharacterized protein LOC115880805 isoform X1 n=1 Tax=Sitophilus oryzae TaxID=7048 RepID=A0A6J2XRC0_SITOR|nr:uncharacterized protein LOC115880805 isoform X1 [Sitophilus oryzae]
MATKPDLSSGAGVQNVVVYVSNDNFGQTYAVEQQNVPQSGNVHSSRYTSAGNAVATIDHAKSFNEKQQIFTSSGHIINSAPGSYITNVLPQNGITLNNITYQNGGIVKNTDILSCERQQAGPAPLQNVKQHDCDNQERYSDSYVTIVGSDVPTQSVRCDSVRSETAESSCSSLSSVDEGMIVVQNRSPNMVVYDPSVSVRPGGVVVVGPPPVPQHASSNTMVVTVPYGWKRLLNNGSVVYISPSNTALSSLEQVKEYLLTSGTCKCGLECHFKYENVFNFDPKISGKPWVLMPDTNTGDLTKLCNHKRKLMAMASMDCKPNDAESKMRKDFTVKHKKRKVGVPYSGGVPVPEIYSQREKVLFNEQGFVKDVSHSQQVWPPNPEVSGRLQGFVDNQHNQIIRCQNQFGGRIMGNTSMVLSENAMIAPQPNVSNNMPGQQMQANQPIPYNNGPNMPLHSHQIIGPNGEVINVQQIQHGPNGMLQQGPNQPMHGQNILHTSHQQQPQGRFFVNAQPTEHSGPGRPNMQMVSCNINQQMKPVDFPQRLSQHHIYNNPQSPYQGDPIKSRHFGQVINTPRPQGLNQNQMIANASLQIQQQQIQQQQKLQWHSKMQQNMNHQQMNQMPLPPQNLQNSQNPNVYERVPPLHQHAPNTVWHEEMRRKKAKLNKGVKNRQYHMIENCQVNSNPNHCPNIDVRQIPSDNNRPIIINQLQQHNQTLSSPSFIEDPSGYLAQQTALLNNTINRQTGAINSGYVCNSPNTPVQGVQQNVIAISNSLANEVPLPSNINMAGIKSPQMSRGNQSVNVTKHKHSTTVQQQNNQISQVQIQHQNIADSSLVHDQPTQYTQPCQGCVSDTNTYSHNQKSKSRSRSDSEPSTPNSCTTSDDPVTSSVYLEKHSNQSSPDTRPIQGGTVSTSNVSPLDGNSSDPPTPNTPHSQGTPPYRSMEFSQNSNINFNVSVQSPHGPVVEIVSQSRENYIQQLQHQMVKSDQNNQYSNPNCSQPNQSKHEQGGSSYSHSNSSVQKMSERCYVSNVVTTMASGRTSGCNTITSVLAGRTNTATVSINSPSNSSGSNTPTSNPSFTFQSQPSSISVSKSPLEMVQSVVSSIQVPHSHQQNVTVSISQASPQVSPQIIKHSPTGLPPGHILVSSNGQLIMASAGNGPSNVMAPPPPKVVNNQSPMPPISVSPMITNVTASVTQVIPAVAQQVLGQQTVLVNALSTPFVIQPGVTMTMDGMTVGQNVQIPQIVTGNVIQQQIQLDNNDHRRAPALLSPETKKKGKKRKMSSQTVAGMLHIAAQQNSGVVMSQQGFPQQIQMTHSPQGLTTTPVMQALTIVPNKTGGPPQIVMNGQAVANANIGPQQIITNSQPTQQINLLQPVNLINGATGVVQNFPAIQQFIVPNIGSSMVMNADGTATILQDTSNLGMQLQIQNVNGQNVLTPIQNSSVFNSGQSILAAGPAGMVIRAPTSQGKIIQQQHSPGAQFLSPNGSQFVVNGAQFSGQLSPLVASVSPSQQVTFSTSPQQIRSNNQIQSGQQEFIHMNGQMGQTLMVPCTPQATNIAASSSNQNTTFVQQNTTIVQQQTTMVANNQQLQNFQHNNSQGHQNVARSTSLNMDHQNFIISSNDKPLQAVMVQQQRASPQDINYRQSVSTQTAANQNTPAVTTNTFCQTSTLCAGSPPDTTTLSPVASGGQSPPTADTTTHSGSTDDGLSPAPSNYSSSCNDLNVQGSGAMAMVHCISSSEPDLMESITPNPEQDWRRVSQSSGSVKHEYSSHKQEYMDMASGHVHYSKRQQNTSQYAESSNVVSGMQFLEHKSKQEVMSSKHYEKIVHQKKSNDMMIVLEAQHASYFDDDNEVTNEPPSDESEVKCKRQFIVGDLIWGPAKTSSAWPGKIVAIEQKQNLATVQWFGREKYISKVNIACLHTLSEGLDAHHRARKKTRTSRKLSAVLEEAIQEAMLELDKCDVSGAVPPKQSKESLSKSDKLLSRLRSGQR